MAKNGDSHLSQANSTAPNEEVAVKQHHRLATPGGGKVTGTSNPYGGPASKTNTVGNNGGKSY